jgi:hypothetical protein
MTDAPPWPVTDRWSPSWAPHVRGAFGPLSPDEPRQFQVTCTICNAEFRGACPTHAVRTRVTQFAALHFHADPLRTTT